MGILRWLRGGDENGASASVISAGLAEIDGLFRPSKHKPPRHRPLGARRSEREVAPGHEVLALVGLLDPERPQHGLVEPLRGVAVLRPKPKPAEDESTG